MSSDEDDYLSEKFLVETTATSAPKTYHERRREAQRVAELKNKQNRKKSRRELEEESRQEGLSKSLFERAKEDEESGVSGGNKAMAMMLKMGYKPGQALGKTQDSTVSTTKASQESSKDDRSAEQESDQDTDTPEARRDSAKQGSSAPQHRVEPIPLSIWAGRKGVGLGKRAHSPSDPQRAAKVIKVLDEKENGAYRNRAREEYEERRAEGRLMSATRTCVTLDEKAGKEFNILWLRPRDPSTIPPELLDKLQTFVLESMQPVIDKGDQETQLRAQMQADALRPLDQGIGYDDEVPQPKEVSKTGDADKSVLVVSDELVEDAYTFLESTAQERLARVLSYLRISYHYCFWCGAEYESSEELAKLCPGEDEEAHD